MRTPCEILNVLAPSIVNHCDEPGRLLYRGMYPLDSFYNALLRPRWQVLCQFDSKDMRYPVTRTETQKVRHLQAVRAQLVEPSNQRPDLALTASIMTVNGLARVRHGCGTD